MARLSPSSFWVVPAYNGASAQGARLQEMLPVMFPAAAGELPGVPPRGAGVELQQHLSLLQPLDKLSDVGNNQDCLETDGSCVCDFLPVVRCCFHLWVFISASCFSIFSSVFSVDDAGSSLVFMWRGAFTSVASRGPTRGGDAPFPPALSDTLRY